MIAQRVAALQLEHFIDSLPIWCICTLGGFEILCDCVVYCLLEYPKCVQWDLALCNFGYAKPQRGQQMGFIYPELFDMCRVRLRLFLCAPPVVF